MSAARGARTRPAAEEAVWQLLESGSYRADLPLWEELAHAAPGPVLEFGAGAGRVAFHLAERGHALLALERSPELAERLEGRAAEDGLPLSVLRRDLESLGAADLPRGLGAVIAPLHLIQQLEPAARPELLAALAGALPPGARFGATLVDEASLLEGEPGPRRVPEMRDLEGWIYSSEPLWVQVDERTIRARWLRSRVDPAGELARAVHDDLLHRLWPSQLEAEAAEAGLRPLERRSLSTADAFADSIAVILEAG